MLIAGQAYCAGKKRGFQLPAAFHFDHLVNLETMQLTTLDWTIIVGYFLVTLAIGAMFTRRAGKNIAEFFVSGRSLPWWIAGTSMVATTFAADTPLAVTGLIVKNGLAGNWFWWAFAFGGMFTVFVYARLWRRAEVMTDVELIQSCVYGASPPAAARYAARVLRRADREPDHHRLGHRSDVAVLEQTVCLTRPAVRWPAGGALELERRYLGRRDRHAGRRGRLLHVVGNVGRGNHRRDPVLPGDGRLYLAGDRGGQSRRRHRAAPSQSREEFWGSAGV